MLNIIKRLSVIVSDIVKILNKQYLSPVGRVYFLFAYISITGKRFLDGRFFNFANMKRQSFLGFIVSFENYSDFYWTFMEIFVNDEYYFKTKNNTPFIVDCGGNIGISVLYFKYLYPNAHILVFEALPDNANILEGNVKRNNLKNIEVVRKAVGGKYEKLRIYGDRRAATICKEFKNKKHLENNSTAEKVTNISIVRLSNYINKQVSFLKMDIESAEGEVFKDLYKYGKIQYVEKTTFEYHRFSLKYNKLSNIIKYLEDSGMETTFIIDSQDPSHITRRDYSHIMVVAERHQLNV